MSKLHNKNIAITNSITGYMKQPDMISCLVRKMKTSQSCTLKLILFVTSQLKK